MGYESETSHSTAAEEHAGMLAKKLGILRSIREEATDLIVMGREAVEDELRKLRDIENPTDVDRYQTALHTVALEQLTIRKWN